MTENLFHSSSSIIERRLSSEELESIINDSDWPNIIKRHPDSLVRLNFLNQATMETLAVENGVSINNGISVETIIADNAHNTSIKEPNENDRERVKVKIDLRGSGKFSFSFASPCS